MSQPSLLFWLPFELLEEISLFFTRAEAVQLLTVNSTLHEVFAGRIWRCITAADSAVWKAPASAWTRYGHLVRSLSIPDSIYSVSTGTIPNVPNLLHLDIYLNEVGSGIFKYEMPLLQQLCVKASDIGWGNKLGLLKAAAAWVAEAEQRDQNISVEWDMFLFNSDNIKWIDDMLDMIHKPHQHSMALSVTKRSFVKLKQLSKLAAMLVQLHSSAIIVKQHGSGAQVVPGSILDNKDITFRKLRHLNIQLTFEDGYGDEIGGSFKATQFPVLESVSLNDIAVYTVYARQPLQTQQPLFSGVFETVTKLQVEKFSGDFVLNSVSGCFPQLRILDISASSLSLCANSMKREWPLLEKVVISRFNNILIPQSDYRGSNSDNDDDDDDNDVNVNGTGSLERYAASLATAAATTAQLLNLHTFELISKDRTEYSSCFESIHFILHHAPNLHTVKLEHCRLEAVTEREIVGEVNQSVRHLEVMFNGNPYRENLLDLILLFPNLTMLKIKRYPQMGDDEEKETYDVKCLFEELCKHYPDLKFEITSSSKTYCTQSLQIMCF
ncbi:hypothetical protein GQ42DRAFT_164574 [Ramicandelaber brevisporus]|nr:hypothetical protein GQ42DRAFT_164574 [Ramicandelaber brevisporus]